MRSTLTKLAVLLVLAGLTVLLLTYRNFILAYFDYFLHPASQEQKVEIVKDNGDITEKPTNNTEVVFVDSDFGLYIPKIKANTTVISNVDPYRESEYLKALKKGVAHAKGSATPNKIGNVFLFAHSEVNFYEQNKYNVYFYLLNKLEKDDKVYLSYKGTLYTYSVINKEFVSPNDVKYLGNYMNQDTLTLMSCWPPGLNLKRTIVTAVREK